MSDQAPQQPQPVLGTTPLPAVLDSLLFVVDQVARKASGAQDVREVAEYGAAALNFAQAYSMLNPEVVAPQGVTPDRIAATVPKRSPAGGGDA